MSEVAKITPASGVTSVTGLQSGDNLIIARSGETRAVPYESAGVAFSYATRAAFVTAVAAGLSAEDGTIVAAGGLFYEASTGATGISDLSGFIPVGPFSIEHWGVVPETNDGSTTVADWSSEIQAAHDYVAGIGGGEIDAGVGVVGFGSTLYFGEGAAVTIKGHGKGTNQNSKTDLRASAETRWQWTGSAGGDGIKLTSDRSNTGLNPMRSDGGIIGLMIDGGESGGIGLTVESHRGSKLDIRTCYWTEGHFESTCLSNGVTGSPADTQGFRWRIAASDVNTTSEPDYLVLITGSGIANTSIGVIEELRLVPESTAVAAHFEYCDAITIENLTAGTRQTASGDGGKVFLHSDDSLPVAAGTAAGHARHLTFKFTQAKQGIFAKATSGGSNNSGPNLITSLSRGNGAPLPTVDAGVELKWMTDEGDLHANAIRFSPTGDDMAFYEELTSFSPVLADASSGGNTATHSTTATYTRIGNLVFVDFVLVNINTAGLTGTNSIYIQGMPYARNSAGVGVGSVLSAGFASPDGVSFLIESGQTYGRFRRNNSGSGSVTYATVNDLTSGTADLFVSLVYQV